MGSLPESQLRWQERTARIVAFLFHSGNLEPVEKGKQGSDRETKPVWALFLRSCLAGRGLDTWLGWYSGHPMTSTASSLSGDRTYVSNLRQRHTFSGKSLRAEPLHPSLLVPSLGGQVPHGSGTSGLGVN